MFPAGFEQTVPGSQRL